MLAPWPIGDKLTRRSDLCNNAGRAQKFSPEGELPAEAPLQRKSDKWLLRMGWIALGAVALAVVVVVMANLALNWRLDGVLELLGIR